MLKKQAENLMECNKMIVFLNRPDYGVIDTHSFLVDNLLITTAHC